jgi:hypothetical protein
MQVMPTAIGTSGKWLFAGCLATSVRDSKRTFVQPLTQGQILLHQQTLHFKATELMQTIEMLSLHPSSIELSGRPERMGA